MTQASDQTVPQPGAHRGWLKHEPARDIHHAGWPDLPKSAAVDFVSAHPISLSAGTKLYRVYGGGSHLQGWWWSPTPPPDSEAEWRADDAVEMEWNSGTMFAEGTVKHGGLAVWAGRATAQPADDASGTAPLPGFMLPGGGQQINVNPAQLTIESTSPTPWQQG